MPLSATLRETAFSWMPDLFTSTDTPPEPGAYSEAALWITATFLIVSTGVLIPVVEELYYRGHLMPRMSRLGWWAPVVSVALWSFSHLWQPWRVVAFFLAFLPMAYAVQWKRNVYLSLTAHVIGNLLMALGLVAPLLGLAP
jgi:membrane protease YdiL (CAAX protease family)